MSGSNELLAPRAHDSGDLEIQSDLVGPPWSLPHCGAHFFLSRVRHRVTPVTQGMR